MLHRSQQWLDQTEQKQPDNLHVFLKSSANSNPLVPLQVSTFQTNNGHLQNGSTVPTLHHDIVYKSDLCLPNYNAVYPFYSSFVSTSFASYEIQSLKLPGYNFTLSNPSISRAKIFGVADIPEPQDTMTSSASSRPAK